MAALRQSENSFELHLPGDRWFRVDERRTADGGSIGVRIDITELKRREASLRLLFAGNPLPMLIFDKETFRFLDVNDAAIAHYGWSREEFLAMTLFDIRSAEDAEKLRLVAGSRDGSYLEGAVWRHKKANGERYRSRSILARSITKGGQRHSSRRLTSRRPGTRRAEVHRRGEFLDSVIENAPAPIIVKDARSLRHMLINRAAEAFLGVARSNVIGKTVEQIYSPQAPPIFLDRIRSFSRIGRKSPMASTGSKRPATAPAMRPRNGCRSSMRRESRAIY